MSTEEIGPKKETFERDVYVRRLIEETPNMTERELEAVKKNLFLCDAAEQAIADSFESERALNRAYDPSVIADEIELARRSLTNDQAYIFMLMLRCRTNGEFGDLCDDYIWDANTNPESIAQQLKRLRKRLQKHRPGKWWFEIRQPKNQDRRFFVWTCRADQPGSEGCTPN